MPATIRWLNRPRPVKHSYSCDKCRVKHSNYAPPDLTKVLHWCHYKTAGGRWMEVERELHLDS